MGWFIYLQVHTLMGTVYTRLIQKFHVKVPNDAVIQAVSVFAVGFADHLLPLAGGDQSITNSNSNFGSCALRAKGFKSPHSLRIKQEITHVIPQKLAVVHICSVVIHLQLLRTIRLYSNPANIIMA
ncbi:MAG: hypothetical protein CM15mV22_0020 [Eurybiavirus sp.]|nr:MAG: hypothetical protein CM15mV22_0020 [Eurybiavirus sp.]